MISNIKKTLFKNFKLAVVLFMAIGITGLMSPQQIAATTTNGNQKTVQPAANIKIIPTKYVAKDIKMSYPQISYLADVNKQKAINQILKNDALRMLNRYKVLGGGFTADINYNVKLNNGKILSVAYSGYCNFKNAAHPSNLFSTTNINITNGARIKLIDLVNINEAFIKKVRAAKYVGPLEQSPDVNTAVNNSRKEFNNDQLIKMFKTADTPQSESFSYLTNDSLVVSIPMMHVIGDYGEFAVKYSDITSDIRTKNVVWKDIYVIH